MAGLGPAIHEDSGPGAGCAMGAVVTRQAEARKFPALPEPLPLARFSAADDLRAAIGLWTAWLAGERRAAI
jgi:hypothetical protein